MANEYAMPNPCQQDFFTDKLRKTLDEQFLQKIIDNSYDSIFITDKLGNVLLSNAEAANFFELKTSELIGSNVNDLLKRELYNWSPTMQAIKTHSIVSGIVRNTRGDQVIVTSKPLMNEFGDILMVITNVRNKEFVDNYIEVLKKGKTNNHLFKTAVKYLCDIDLKNKDIVAESQQMRQIIKTSNIIAKTDSTVMIIGETGTGKDVMARNIHRNSLRSKEPFIPVNCGAIPRELLESEFFGYVKGAFSGANPQGKPGLFEIADKGTLFLDEIAELPLDMQSKILRVIESSEAKRLGDTNIYHANVRFIAATNRDLKEMISKKLFRSDLYYRLNVIPISLPPLRERPEDILALANKFLEELNIKYALNKTFSSQASQAFLSYGWPGNVRELRNVIERLVITTIGNVLNFEDDSLTNGDICLDTTECRSEPNRVGYSGTLKSVLKEVENKYIHQVLNECGGRVGEAARRLGIHRTMLYRKTIGRLS